MSEFIIWVEIEEVNDEGDNIEDHSAMLDGASIARFATLDEAVTFGDKFQEAGWAMASLLGAFGKEV